LIVKGENTLNPNGQSSNASVIIELKENFEIKVPTFERYEYRVDILENLSKMSQIFTLEASFPNKNKSNNHLIRYKLENHLDKFYLNEKTGRLFNKISFDYESSPTNLNNQKNQLDTMFQLKVKAFNSMGNDDINDECLITVRVIDVNDNAPNFEKAVYSSRIEIDQTLQYYKNLNENNFLTSIISVLNDFNTSQTSDGPLKFVTKVNANDLDRNNSRLDYTILSQYQQVDPVDELHIQRNTKRFDTQRDQLIGQHLFLIDQKEGIVYINRYKYQLFKQFIDNIRFQVGLSYEKSTKFHLQLQVNDGMFTATSRLTVQVDYSRLDYLKRPQFQKNVQYLSLNQQNFDQKCLNINLNHYLTNAADTSGLNSHLFLINTDKSEFFIKNKSNLCINQLITKDFYQIPIQVCHHQQLGLCDQLLLMLNTTSFNRSDQKKETPSTMTNSNEKTEQINNNKSNSFAYNYAAVTVQQLNKNKDNSNDNDLFYDYYTDYFTSSSSPSSSSSLNKNNNNKDYLFTDDINMNGNDDLYYYDEAEIYEPNDRFYFELKTIDYSAIHFLKTNKHNKTNGEEVIYNRQKEKFNYNMLNCTFTPLNITFRNKTIGKQVYQLAHHQRKSYQQLRNLFLLNKHNGVLSSRKIINEMLPGVYQFEIELNFANETSKVATSDLVKQESSVIWQRIDLMVFKLIVLPPNSAVRNESKYLQNHFKFERDFYKFFINSTMTSESGDIKPIGRISLEQKSNLTSEQQKTVHIYHPIFTLAPMKYSLDHLIQLDSISGILYFRNSINESVNLAKEWLNDQNELLVHAIATVKYESMSYGKVYNILEYMCEIRIDFNSILRDYATLLILSGPIDGQGQLSPSSRIYFAKNQYQLEINKNLEPNTAIHRFIALLDDETMKKLKDYDETKWISYSISTNNQYFQVIENSGELILNKKLTKFTQQQQQQQQYDDSNRFNITACIISDELNYDLTCAQAVVNVIILNNNNEKPTFKLTNNYNSTIRIDDLPGTVIVTAQATDPDNDPIEYFILNGDGWNQFAISPDGKIYTRLVLNRVDVHYKLTLLAFDGRFKGLTTLNIRVIDDNFLTKKRPFECTATATADETNQRHITIEETAHIGQAILTIFPHTFNDYKYTILENKNSLSITKPLPFVINENNGVIYVGDKLNYEIQREYIFYVRVLTVDEVPGEKTTPTTQLQQFSNIKDDNEIPWTGQCIIKVVVKLQDINNNKPEFTRQQYIGQLVENSPIGTVIHLNPKIKAKDRDTGRNGIIRYSIRLDDQMTVDYSIEYLIQIDAKSGAVKTNGSIDRELIGDWLNVTIRAEGNNDDDGFNKYKPTGYLSSTTTLCLQIIDVNDNHPVFKTKQQFVSVEESLNIGFVVTKVNAIDLDLNDKQQKGHTQYFLHNITSGSSLKPAKGDEFLVGMETGDVVVNSLLDYETISSFVLNIVAIDPHLSSNQSDCLTLTIDLLDDNDNPPQFNSSVPSDVYLKENVALNTTVLQLAAFDLDATSKNNKINFKILTQKSSDNLQNEVNVFAIDATTGRIYTAQSIDFEMFTQSPLFHLVVEAADSGERTTLKTQKSINIHIVDVNDNAPTFIRPNQTFIFRDTFRLGAEMTQFQVEDADSNSNAGPFTFNIIKQLRRPSLPVGLEYSVNNSDSSEPIELTQPIFALSASGNGLILIKKPISSQTYILKVRCYDSGIPPLFTDTWITVRVTDDPGNEPTINSAFIQLITIAGTEMERIKVGQVIGEIKAHDKDVKDELFFSLDDTLTINIGEESDKLVEMQYFTIDTKDGKIKLKRPLKVNQPDVFDISYNFKASVTDRVFLSEADVNIVSMVPISKKCALNSLFIKFQVLSIRSKLNSYGESDSIIKHFVSNGYLRRFRHIIGRMTGFAERLRTRLEVSILSIRQQQTPDDLLFNENESNQLKSSTLEIVFSVERPRLMYETVSNLNSGIDEQQQECIDGKAVVKLLTRRKRRFISKLKRTNDDNDFKLRVVDISYNHECSTSNDNKRIEICSTNMALQNCRLHFDGYNSLDDVCEDSPRTISNQKCLLMPKHSWSCESIIRNDYINNLNYFEPKQKHLGDEITIEGGNNIIFKPKTSTKPNEIDGSLIVDYKVKTINRQVYGCEFSPCQNGGVCKEISHQNVDDKQKSFETSPKVHCFCAHGFRGRFCEEDINECIELQAQHRLVPGELDKRPCAPGASCHNTYGSYFCNCTKTTSSPTECYNIVSALFSASIAEKTRIITENEIKKGRETFKNNQLFKTNGNFNENDVDELRREVSILGLTSDGVRMALLSIFGGILFVLIVLSLIAGVVCRMNISRRDKLRKARILIDHHRLTDSSNPCTSSSCASGSGSGASNGCNSATDTAGDICSSSTVSPCSYDDSMPPPSLPPLNKQKKSLKNRNKIDIFSHRKSKQRSSFTCALLPLNNANQTTTTTTIDDHNLKMESNFNSSSTKVSTMAVISERKVKIESIGNEKELKNSSKFNFMSIFARNNKYQGRASKRVLIPKRNRISEVDEEEEGEEDHTLSGCSMSETDAPCSSHSTASSSMPTKNHDFIDAAATVSKTNDNQNDPNGLSIKIEDKTSQTNTKTIGLIKTVTNTNPFSLNFKSNTLSFINDKKQIVEKQELKSFGVRTTIESSSTKTDSSNYSVPCKVAFNGEHKFNTVTSSMKPKSSLLLNPASTVSTPSKGVRFQSSPKTIEIDSTKKNEPEKSSPSPPSTTTSNHDNNDADTDTSINVNKDESMTMTEDGPTTTQGNFILKSSSLYLFISHHIYFVAQIFH
jgi:hypothetical protein